MFAGLFFIIVKNQLTSFAFKAKTLDKNNYLMYDYIGYGIHIFGGKNESGWKKA